MALRSIKWTLTTAVQEIRTVCRGPTHSRRMASDHPEYHPRHLRSPRALGRPPRSQASGASSTGSAGARPGGALFGSRARCSARLSYLPCCNMEAYGGFGEGRGSAARCVLRSSHERPYGVRARLETHDRHAGAGFLGLRVDDGVGSFGGHVNAGWVGTTPPPRMRQFHAWATTEETDRRWYHCSHHE
jgi:hypothetical protein